MILKNLDQVGSKGFDFTINYDPLVLRLIRYDDTNSILVEDYYTTIINNQRPGQLKLSSYAHASPLDVSGLLGDLEFEVISDNVKSSRIYIEEIEINEILTFPVIKYSPCQSLISSGDTIFYITT